MDLITLAQAGPAAILLVGIVALAGLFIKGTFVPGWIYQREVARGDRLEVQVALNTEALTALAKTAANGANGAVAKGRSARA